MVIEEGTGDNMKKIYFGLSGSDANDTNIKLFVVLQQSYRSHEEKENNIEGGVGITEQVFLQVASQV